VVFIAVISGLGGGIIRDVLLNEMPLVLYKEIYISAVVVGALAFMTVLELGASQSLAFVLAMVVSITIRILAIRYDWSLPRLRSLQTTNHLSK